MKHKSSYYTILLLAAIIGCVLRFWNLTAGIDAQGLPYSGHISAYLMAGWWVLCALLFAVISKPRSGLSSDHSVLYCGGSGALLGYLGAGFILISALLRFVDALTAGPTMSAPFAGPAGRDLPDDRRIYAQPQPSHCTAAGTPAGTLSGDPVDSEL